MKTPFFQSEPKLGPQFVQGSVLERWVRQTLPAEVFAQVQPHLEQVGLDAVGPLLEWSKQAEEQEPVLQNFDSWGRRIDKIHLSPGWKNLEAYASREGLVAAGYERKQGEWSRVYQMALLQLFHPSSAFVSCPLAMTDGAARLIEVYGDAEMKKNAFAHLTSRDPAQFWFSGQWMTERTGGSDVGLSETTAEKDGKDHRLSGVKWFTSATTAQMAMTLARLPGAEAGGRGLSLFYLETGAAKGSLDQIEVLRLKDKLGTRAMPTAELELKNTKARLMGGEGNGIRKIATLFNITRIYNSVCSVAQMQRALAWAQSFAAKRVAFGATINEHPAMQATLADLELELEGGVALVMEISRLLGREEMQLASPAEASLLRVLTPLAKLYTGKNAVRVTSEVVEIFAGAGYCEDTGLPRLLRDAQVFPIWEGTTNVLSLDVLRALSKECPWAVLNEEWQARSAKLQTNSKLQAQWQHLHQVWDEMQKDAATAGATAREWSWMLTRVWIGLLLAEMPQGLRDRKAAAVEIRAAELRAKRWVEETKSVVVVSEARRLENQVLAGVRS